MSAASHAIVYNPTKLDRPALQSAWEAVAGGARVRWYPTTAQDPGGDAARTALADGCDTVIAAGGDGTVRSVAEALAGTPAALGIVPAGTGNLLARNLGLPLGDVEAALRRVLAGRAEPIDMGWVEVTLDGAEQRHGFVVMVGFGVDANMLAETNEELKDRAGWLAYVEAMGRALSASRVHTFEVGFDGEPAHEASAHTVLVGNCGEVQGGIRLLPDARVDDGVLDVLVVGSSGVAEWLDTIRAMVWDNGIMKLFDPGKGTTDSGTLAHRQASRIEVRFGEPVRFEIDGEEIGKVSAFRASVDPGALRVC